MRYNYLQDIITKLEQHWNLNGQPNYRMLNMEKHQIIGKLQRLFDHLKLEEKKKQGFYKKYNVSRVDGKTLGHCLVLEFNDPNAHSGIQAWSEHMRKEGYVVLANEIDGLLREAVINNAKAARKAQATNYDS